MSKLNILRNVVVISLSDTSLWTGRAKMTAEDLGLSDEQVPPDAIASLGSKRVIDGDALKPLNKIRYLMRRACLEVGTRFLGGFAVAIEEAESLVTKLNKLVEQGEAIKKSFLATVDNKIDAWHESNPKWKHIMSAGTPERDSIGKKISFGYHAIMVQTPENDTVARSLLGAVDMMGNNLIDEIVSEARAFVQRSLVDGREQGSQKTVGPIRRLGNKIHALRFIDPALGAMAEVVKRVLQTIPETGKIEAESFLNMTRVANLLASRARFSETSLALHEGRLTVDQVVNALTCETKPVKSETLPLEKTSETAMNVQHIFPDDSAPQIPEKDADVLKVIAQIRPDVTGVKPQTKPAQRPTVAEPLDF